MEYQSPRSIEPHSACSSFPIRFFSPLLLLLVILAVFVSQAFARRTERLVGSWKPLDYNVSLAFNERLTEITNARTQITILTLKDNVSLIDLDFGDLPIDAVTVNHRAAPYERSTDLLKVKLSKAVQRDTRLAIVVTYHGKPKDGLILSVDKAGKRAVVGDNWPDRVHHWIPCLDHPSAKATVTFTVTAPEENVVVANGEEVGKTEDVARKTQTWTYSESVPIPPYCMIIAVGDFAQLGPPTMAGPPLSYYVPQPDKNFAMQGFAPALPSLKFFSQTVGPYPYEKLALIVGATRFGGMENSSAIVFGSTLLDPRSSESVSRVFNIREGLVDTVAHEIAHQWFGDSVTESTWSDLWLSEGFATYFAGLFIQRHEGEEVFQKFMKSAADKALDYEKKTHTPIHDSDTEDLSKLLNANNYQKGAWVLHMLRSELGDERFFRGIRIYYEAHKNATADSNDLRAAFEKASGRDLRDFFASWVYGVGHPRYELAWTWNNKTKKVRLVLRQLQKEPAFPNTLPIDIVVSSGKRRFLIKAAGRQTDREFDLGEDPVSVSLDPDNTVLKEGCGTAGCSSRVP
jgi:aminopeptidase N